MPSNRKPNNNALQLPITIVGVLLFVPYGIYYFIRGFAIPYTTSFLYDLWYAIPYPRYGIYSQPGRWYSLKFNLMKYVIARRQNQSRSIKSKAADPMDSEFGGVGYATNQELDRKHDLPEEEPRPIDAVFFDGCNKDGWYVTVGTAQRKDNIINLFSIIRIPGVGTFVNPETNSCSTNVKSIPSKDWKTECGFNVAVDIPMRQWTISYKGNLVKSLGERKFTKVGVEPIEEEELIPAEFTMIWTNFGEHFDFDRECSPTSIAHSLAIEPWSSELFKKLRASHQAHYEQFGFLDGQFRIGSEIYNNIHLTSMRDHTIAKHRNWADIRRYIMMIYHLDDGTCIHTSVISMPGIVFTQLEFGYVITPEKKKYAVDRIYFNLADHGEDREFPKKFKYSFEAGPLHYDVDVHIIEVVSFKMGMDLACQVNENMAKYTANGVNGQGFAETVYRIEPY